MSRSPDEVQHEIERTRSDLATTLDQIAERANPKRLAAQGQANVRDFLQTPAGKAVLGSVGGVVLLIVVARVRAHRS